MKRKSSGLISGLGVGAILFAALSTGIQAAEGIRPAGPIGGTDIKQALLPPPGLYAVGVGIGMDLPARFSTRNHELNSSGSTGAAGVGLLYVYDRQVLGGSLASSISASYERTCFGLEPGPERCSSGFADDYSDILMWSRFFPSARFTDQPPGSAPIPFGVTVLVGLGVNFSTGTYDSDRPVNIGSNVFDIAPNFALTYTTRSIFGDGPGQATEFSARFFLNNYTKNSDTDYQTGRLANVDFAITQIVNQWQFGLAGAAYLQFEDDEIGGRKHPNDGNRMRGLSVGPIVSYDFIWDKKPWNATLKGFSTVLGENATVANGIIFRLSTKLF